jgi:hypothetical protein
VSTVTFWAVDMAASSWLTRWEMGALEPTQGQAALAADAACADCPAGAALAGGAPPATLTRDAATAAAAVSRVRARAG